MLRTEAPRPIAHECRPEPAEEGTADDDRHRNRYKSDCASTPEKPTPKCDQSQTRRHPAGRQPDQCTGQGRAQVPEYSSDDESRWDELAAIDQGHAGIRKQ